MSTLRQAGPLFLVAVASAALGCGPSEQDARSYLESQGYTVNETQKDDKIFKFTATKGQDICHGTVSITKGIGTSSQFVTSECERDTSACKPGAVAECMKLGDELYGKDEKLFPTKAAELYRTACGDKDGRACARVAEFEAIDKHWDKVREFAQKGCDLGDGDGCRRLGHTEFEGLGTPKDEAKALEIFKKGCGLSSLKACRGAAGLLIDRTPRDVEGAMPFVEKLCNAKYPEGCFLLGVLLFDAKKDWARSLGYFDAECENAKSGFRGTACNYAGVITADGNGMPKDVKRGMAYYAKACDLDDANGCKNAGVRYQKGAGVPRDAKKASELFAKACKLGKQDACSTK
jgi:TPR repeat protein